MSLQDAEFQKQVQKVAEELRQALEDTVSEAIRNGMEFPLTIEVTDVEGGRSTFLLLKDYKVHMDSAELSELWLCPRKIVVTDGGGKTVRGAFYDVPPQEAS